MRISRPALIIIAAFLAQPVLAMDMDSDSKPCADIAKVCLDAGYSRDSESKMFWKDCMKPLLLGQTVEGVTISNDTVKMCRSDKIARMKKELSELQKAFNGNVNNGNTKR